MPVRTTLWPSYHYRPLDDLGVWPVVLPLVRLMLSPFLKARKP
jgi:hypothetical protein